MLSRVCPTGKWNLCFCEKTPWDEEFHIGKKYLFLFSRKQLFNWLQSLEGSADVIGISKIDICKASTVWLFSCSVLFRHCEYMENVIVTMLRSTDKFDFQIVFTFVFCATNKFQ